MIMEFHGIERQSKGLKRLFTVLKRKIPELLITVFVASILLIVASTLIYYVEPETFNTIPEGIWWATQTLTTVGYGDIYPKSSGGRVIGVFVAFLGVCLFALPAGVLGSGLMEIVAEKRHAEEMAKIRKRILNQRKQREQNSNSFVTNGIKGRMQEEEDDDRIPKFSEVFDLDNLEHMKYAASLFCGNTYGHVDSNVWNKYAPEDGGIVGLNPIIEKGETRLYVSGPNADKLEILNGNGLIVKNLGIQIGQASAFKMIYASATKGTFALHTAVITAAHKYNLFDEYVKELEFSKPDILKSMEKMVPKIPLDAKRWEGEMYEIMKTYEYVNLTSQFHAGSAEIMKLAHKTPIAKETRQSYNQDRTLKQAVEMYVKAINKD